MYTQTPSSIVRSTLTGIFLSLLVFAGPAFAADDADYLESIAPDDTDINVTTARTLEQVSSREDEHSFPSGLDPSGFEEDLRSRFTGSFMFYSKLSSAKKKLVYDEYLVSKDIEMIRKKIISLFSSR